MLGFAVRLTRNRDDAEDVLQDACIKMLVSFRHYDERRSFVNWAFRVIQRVFLDRLRMGSRRVQAVSVEDAPLDMPIEFEDPAPSIESVLVAEAGARQQLLNVEPRDRKFIEAYLETDNMREASDMFGAHRTRVWRAVRRARKTVARTDGV